MAHLSIKKTLLGALATLMFALQLPLPAMAAASDQTALTASQAGVSYLSANQNNDGSISGSLGGTTDWSVMGIEASGRDSATFNNGSGISALDFLKTDTPSPTASATDVERKIIAVKDAGQNPQAFGGINYDSVLAGYHNNQQIGDPVLLNDDIFGVVAASAAQDPALQSTAQDGLDYFLSHQAADGGFSYTTDTCAYCGSDSNDTAAAIIAMQAASSLGLTNANLANDEAKALAYLLSTQQTDGGFAYDVFSPSDGGSTAWGLMALNSVGDTVHSQALLARDWLLANQNGDGGFSYGAYGITTSDTYTTAHAILALLGTTWLLQPDPIKAASTPPPVPANVSGNGVANSPASTTIITSTSNPAPQASTDPVNSDTQSATDGTKVLGTQASNLGADTTILPIKHDSKHDSTAIAGAVVPSSKYTKYAAALLGLIAISWYILQSRLKRGEK